MGTSIAYHLAAAGLSDAILIEKEPLLGCGSSAASAGIIYHHLAEKINLQLSQKSLQRLLQFEDEFDVAVDFRKSGCIQTAATVDDLSELERIVRTLSGMGVDARLVKSHELAELIPGLVVADLLGGIYTPNDGYFDPYGVIRGYSVAAQRMGVKILTRTPVVGIEVKGGMVAGVRTPNDFIETRIVVNAAGPRAKEIAGFAGITELPVVPYKRQIFISSPTDIVPSSAPFYFDRDPPFYFRPESGGLLTSIAELWECPNHDLSVDWSSVPALAERATHRLPPLESLRIVRGWAGLRSMTPDNTAILGPVPQPTGLYLAVGFSGHGVMHAPMTGKILASMIIDHNIDRFEEIDLAPLRYGRFLSRH